MWYTACKKEHIRIRWRYHLLIKIKKGEGKKSILGGKRHVIAHYQKHDHYPTLLLLTARKRCVQTQGTLQTPDPGSLQRSTLTTAAMVGAQPDSWDSLRLFFNLVARPIILVRHPICRHRGFWLLQTSATSSMVAKHNQPDGDTLG